MKLTIRLPIVKTTSGPVLPMVEAHTICACQDDDPYLCWAKRYSLDCDATNTIRAAVINDGGPCRCWCHAYLYLFGRQAMPTGRQGQAGHDEDEWANELVCPDATTG